MGSLRADPVIKEEPEGAKIRLLSEALLARDAGDLSAARKHLEALLALNPADETVRGLLLGLDKMTAKSVQVSGGIAADTGSGAEIGEADALARAETARQEGLLRAAQTARDEAKLVMQRREYQKAAEMVAQARSGLPVNPLTQSVVDELAALQVEIQEAAAAGASSPVRNEPMDKETAEPRDQLSGQMLTEVRQAWRRPSAVSVPASVPVTSDPVGSALSDRLDQIVLPSINFSGMELSRVISTLSVISADYDPTDGPVKGVNLVLLGQEGANPPVSLTLRNISLKRLLDALTDSLGYEYEVQADMVVVRPPRRTADVDMEFFPVSRSTVLRMTGQNATTLKEGRERAGGAQADTGGLTTRDEGQAIRSFLQLAGVSFDEVPGSALAFDGTQLIVTQTPRNLERVRNILRRYSAVRQVEIEAKFMEVQQGALEELGVQWEAATKLAQRNAGAQATYQTGNGINRTLGEAFRNATTTQQITVTGTGQPEEGLVLSAAAPTMPGGVLLGAGAGPLASIKGVVGEFDVNAIVRALSQQSGTELLSAPKLTVLSGNQATITVAQEMRYPQSYGQIQSQVGTGSISGGGSAGVSITSGTPQEFTSRNVGVELKVTPTVEEDDHSVSLDLNPKVTEFEGFVEYGGPSIAISGGTTVTVPPGFYQPIFAVREVTTKVTIWDGATLMMGGLTREEVKKVSDKVPVLGSLPLIGRLFRSQGESSQKRNLLIFVTANLVTPGGGLSSPGRMR